MGEETGVIRQVFRGPGAQRATICNGFGGPGAQAIAVWNDFESPGFPKSFTFNAGPLPQGPNEDLNDCDRDAHS